MKRILLICCCLSSFLLIHLPSNADAYWRYHRERRFHPRFALSLAGGATFVDYYNDYGEPYTLAHAMFNVGTHLWVHPNLSIDLGFGTHFLTRISAPGEWGYFSIKPGVRARLGIFYFRAALDVGFGQERNNRPFLYGFLFGIGLRFPIGWRIRLFAEIDYQYLFCQGYYMPFYGQLGIEFMF